MQFSHWKPTKHGIQVNLMKIQLDRFKLKRTQHTMWVCICACAYDGNLVFVIEWTVFFSHSCVWLYLCKVPSINNNTRGKNTTYTWDKQTNKNKHTNIYLLKRFTRTMMKLKFFDKIQAQPTNNYRKNTLSHTHTKHTLKTTEQIAEFSWIKKNIVKYTTSSRWTEHTPIHGHLLIVWRRCIVRQTHGLLWSETWAK